MTQRASPSMIVCAQLRLRSAGGGGDVRARRSLGACRARPQPAYQYKCPQQVATAGCFRGHSLQHPLHLSWLVAWDIVPTRDQGRRS
jgi:hypothetical protein